MTAFARMIQSNAKLHVAALQSQFAAGAQGAAKSAWTEINRPLTALGLSDVTSTATTKTLTLGPLSLPIGMDIKSVTCLAADIDLGWMATSFTFGTLNLVNPQSSADGVNLSMFDPRLEHSDRLAPWILSKTKVDVQVSATLVNQTCVYSDAGALVQPSAVFHGFSLNAFQEEQVCAIQTRIEPTDRNVGVAELINLQRQTIGGGLGIALPAQMQAPAAIGPVNRAVVQQYHPSMAQPRPRIPR